MTLAADVATDLNKKLTTLNERLRAEIEAWREIYVQSQKALLRLASVDERFMMTAESTAKHIANAHEKLAAEVAHRVAEEAMFTLQLEPDALATLRGLVHRHVRGVMTDWIVGDFKIEA